MNQKQIVMKAMAMMPSQSPQLMDTTGLSVIYANSDTTSRAFSNVGKIVSHKSLLLN